MAKNNVEEISVEKEPRMDERVKVRSIAPWTTGAARKTTNGDISIPPKGSVLLTREEIISQSQNGNRLISGIDSVGSHAHWYIEDDFTRKYLSFDTDEGKQKFLHEDVVKKMFDLKSIESFKKRLKENVVTRAEKAYLMECIKTLDINDYQKITCCVEYTGMKL